MTGLEVLSRLQTRRLLWSPSALCWCYMCKRHSGSHHCQSPLVETWPPILLAVVPWLLWHGDHLGKTMDFQSSWGAEQTGSSRWSLGKGRCTPPSPCLRRNPKWAVVERRALKTWELWSSLQLCQRGHQVGPRCSSQWISTWVRTKGKPAPPPPANALSGTIKQQKYTDCSCKEKQLSRSAFFIQLKAKPTCRLAGHSSSSQRGGTERPWWEAHWAAWSWSSQILGRSLAEEPCCFGRMICNKKIKNNIYG